MVTGVLLAGYHTYRTVGSLAARVISITGSVGRTEVTLHTLLTAGLHRLVLVEPSFTYLGLLRSWGAGGRVRGGAGNTPECYTAGNTPECYTAGNTPGLHDWQHARFTRLATRHVYTLGNSTINTLDYSAVRATGEWLCYREASTLVVCR